MRVRDRGWRRGSPLGACVLATALALGQSQRAEVIHPTLQRALEPVIIWGSALPELCGIPVHSIRAFRYDADSCRWQAIPFQIDEVRNGDYFQADDGLLDADDELVLFSADVGARVPDGFWLPGEEVRRWPRVEIELADSLDTSQRGWVYLFVNPPETLLTSVPSYLDYDPRTDRVRGRYYLVGYNSRGILADIHITRAGGGSDVDLVDRQKQRVKGNYKAGPVTYNYKASEENIERQGVDFRLGPVRLLRRLRAKLTYMNLVQLEVSFTTRFYPRSFYLSGSGNISSELGVYHIRQSLDLNANAVGMQFLSERNDSIRIDGSRDNVDKALSAPGRHWLMATGPQGTILTLVEVPRAGDYQLLYYWDASSGTGDGTDDTGDGRSYGDAGVYLYSSGGRVITGQASFASWTYLLPANQPRETGERLLSWWENPLKKRIELQWPDTIPPAPVTDLVALPEGLGGIRLEWTAPGDDSARGIAERYEIRYSPSPPESTSSGSLNLEPWFETATPLPDSSRPSPAGTREIRVYAGLEPRTRYFFALRAVDEAGLRAPVSNVAAVLVVPVELSTFRAHCAGDSVVLSWVTQSETSNWGFAIERTAEGSSWQTIGFVRGIGTSDSPRSYRFVDRPATSGRYAYRLRQIDYDGSFVYSSTLYVDVNRPQRAGMTVNPNPFNGRTLIRLQLPGATEARIRILNVLGQTVREETFSSSGGGIFEMPWDGRDDRGRELPSGTYIVRAESPGRQFLAKVLLVR